MQDIRDENARKVVQEREDAKRREQADIKRSQEGWEKDPMLVERQIRDYKQTQQKPK
jgi:hypothetical protein